MPPDFNNPEKVTIYQFFGDGRGDKERKEDAATIGTLQAYKENCIAQFALATMCLREIELSEKDDKIEYKDGDIYRIIDVHHPFLGEKFTITGNQSLKSDEKVSGSLVHRNSSFKLNHIDIIPEKQK